MKKIKIIDLLNKIANGEEVPKKIKWRNIIWIYNDEDQDYTDDDDDALLAYNFCNHTILGFINDEVEIIEEKEKIISIIQDYGVKMKEFCETTRRIWKLIEEYPIEKEEEKEIEKIKVTYADNRSNEEVFEYLRCTINELIDAVNGIRKEK